mmetsp:Transcript_12045/g.42230  ORF Transcript_12045/g.42230 Transcript_12045/m.42230 type:complete len:221 (-) Transcript_12045:119-781(-)
MPTTRRRRRRRRARAPCAERTASRPCARRAPYPPPNRRPTRRRRARDARPRRRRRQQRPRRRRRQHRRSSHSRREGGCRSTSPPQSRTRATRRPRPRVARRRRGSRRASRAAFAAAGMLLRSRAARWRQHQTPICAPHERQRVSRHRRRRLPWRIMTCVPAYWGRRGRDGAPPTPEAHVASNLATSRLRARRGGGARALLRAPSHHNGLRPRCDFCAFMG